MEKNSFRKLINSRINREELIKSPELYNALENDKIIRLDFLSTVKPNLIDTKGFKNEKRKNMVEYINVFKQIYYKDYMLNKNSLDKIYKISNENNVFLNHFSGFNKYYDNRNQKEVLNEIQLKYKNKMGFSPIIKENGNLFSNSILLQNDKDLRQYISLDLDTIKNDSNSLSFLKNIRNKIKLNGSKSKANNILESIQNEDFTDNTDREKDLINVVKNSYKLKSTKKTKERNQSISELIKDINKAKECFKSIDNLNYFLNTNKSNPDKLVSSRKSSGEATTRMNSGVKKLNINLKIKDDLNNFLGKANNTTDKIQYNDKKIIKNNNSIILPLIKNDNINYSTNESNYYNKIKNNNKKKEDDNIKIIEPNEKEMKNKFYKINISKNNFNTINKRALKHKKKIGLRKQTIGLEDLYEKISKTDNFIDYNKEIRNYLKENKYDIKNNINGKELYKSVDKSRRKITDNSSIQKNYDLMVDNKLKSYEQNKKIFQNNDKIKKNIENIEERMIDLLCDVNKYGDY